PSAKARSKFSRWEPQNARHRSYDEPQFPLPHTFGALPVVPFCLELPQNQTVARSAPKGSSLLPASSSSASLYSYDNLHSTAASSHWPKFPADSPATSPVGSCCSTNIVHIGNRAPSDVDRYLLFCPCPDAGP